MGDQPIAPPAATIELAPLPSLPSLTQQFWRDLLGGLIRGPGGEESTLDRMNGGGWEE